MHLIVGLGNPGSKYDGTRHNVGFQILDYLAAENNVQFHDSKWQAQVAKTSLKGVPVLLVKPETFMNESGRAVGFIASYYRVSPQNIIVIHDDLDIELTRLKAVVNRGAGGHNGITSIINHLGTKDFVRIRFGVGRPKSENASASKFVLSRFGAEELSVVGEKLKETAGYIELILVKGVVPAMGMINDRRK